MLSPSMFSSLTLPEDTKVHDLLIIYNSYFHIMSTHHDNKIYFNLLFAVAVTIQVNQGGEGERERMDKVWGGGRTHELLQS